MNVIDSITHIRQQTIYGRIDLLNRKQRADLRAEILAVLLAAMPQNKDLKMRMDAIQDMTDAVMEAVIKSTE